MAPPAIDASIGGSASNSYLTRSDANTYHTTRLFVSDWTGASDDDKDTALIWATRLLDEQIEWYGTEVDDTQALQWPRSSMVDDFGRSIATTVIPQRVKNATAELARYLIASDRTSQQSSAGLDRVKVGEVEVDFAEDAGPPEREVIPDSVYQMVALWGRLKFQKSGGRVRLMRG